MILQGCSQFIKPDIIAHLCSDMQMSKTLYVCLTNQTPGRIMCVTEVKKGFMAFLKCLFISEEQNYYQL